MLVRQYIGDRSKERLATYEIAVVGRQPLDPLPPSTDVEVAQGIRGVVLAMNGLGRLHYYVSPSLGENPNAFTLKNSDDFGTDISSDDAAAHVCPVGAIMPKRGAYTVPIGERYFDEHDIDEVDNASGKL